MTLKFQPNIEEECKERLLPVMKCSDKGQKSTEKWILTLIVLTY